MSTRIDVDVTIENDEIIKAGHKPGIIQIGSATLFFREALWTGEPLTAMKALREVLDSQIEDIESKRGKPVAAPADPAPLTAATDYAIRTMLENESVPVSAPSQQNPWCSSKDEHGFACTRFKKHEGDHRYPVRVSLVHGIDDDTPF